MRRHNIYGWNEAMECGPCYSSLAGMCVCVGVCFGCSSDVRKQEAWTFKFCPSSKQARAIAFLASEWRQLCKLSALWAGKEHGREKFASSKCLRCWAFCVVRIGFACISESMAFGEWVGASQASSNTRWRPLGIWIKSRRGGLNMYFDCHHPAREYRSLERTQWHTRCIDLCL